MPAQKNPDSNEDALVSRIARKLHFAKSAALPIGVGDDAALWRPTAGYQTVLTCDWFLEGSHFLREKHPADAVGWKCLARAASDVAAMGGKPRGFLLSLALPGELSGKWLDDFLGGLRRASKALRCEPAGGDTTRQDKVLINVTVIGEVRKDRAVLRSGARPGDLLFVSGTLGEADLGLRQLRTQKRVARASNAALRKHLYPEPHLALGYWLAQNRFATAMMDLSDGLSTDLPRLCKASGVGAVVAEGAVPRPSGIPEAQAVRLALDGGDDYELLFTVRPSNVPRFKRSLQKSFPRLAISNIGAITETKKLLLLKKEGVTQEFSSGGWDPFRKK
jgi:thiamine-monophosphate kinase